MNTNSKLLAYLIILVMFSSLALGEVVVFSKYETQTTLEKDVLHIKREVTLTNVGSNPIIPGELHFKIHEIKKGERVPSQITNFKAYNDYRADLKTRQIEGNTETDLVVSVWEPVLPKFNYKIMIEYDIVFQPKGILFYEMVVPTEETTIPIKENINDVFIPSGYHITYAPDAEVKKVEKEGENYRVVKWNNKKNMVMEYSKLPLPRLGVKAVNLFWSAIIAIVLIMTFVIHKWTR